MKPHLPAKALPRKSLYFLFGACLLLAFSPLGIMQSGLDGPTKVGNYYNGEFPSLPPGTFVGGGGGGGGLRLVNAFPRLTFTDPIEFQQAPNSTKIYVASRGGVIQSFDNNPNANNTQTVLNISSAVANVVDGGFLSFCFHPDFNSGSRYFYTYYCAKGSGGKVYLRLSRFTMNNNGTANKNSELIMINVRLYGRTHRGGTCIFGDDGFLYLSIGDQERFETSQNISNNFEGGIFRIDVDQRANRSHPPKRRMGRDAGNSDEYTGVGYWIPDSNPWVRGGNNKSVFEEYYAIGSRQPYRMRKDRQTGNIWFSEVGSNKEEEINFLRKAANYQWPYKEGKNSPGRRPKPNNIIGNEWGPVVSFERNESSAIIGGYLVRNPALPAFDGKYICAGYELNRIFSVTPNGNNSNGTKKVELNFPGSVINIGEDAFGQIYLMGLGRNQKIYRLQQGNGSGTIVQAPNKLSKTGVFKNMNTLELGDGFIPYEPITKLYSDEAQKFRAVAIPNNGSRFRNNQKIKFSEEGDWEFPVGTVFLKHFEINTDKNNPNKIKRLETRILVVDENGEYYGLTYRWNANGTEANLLEGGEQETIRIKQKNGSNENLVWEYPSRSDCFQCHTSAAEFALGLKTRHLNSDIRYPSTGKIGNQVETFSSIGAFNQELNPNRIKNFLTQAALEDESETLERRARSYLDINCSSCHRPGTSVRASFDLRLTTDLEDANLIDEDPFDDLGVNRAKIIVEGDPEKSILYLRMNTVDPCCKMPPLGRNTVHEEAVDVVREWILRLGAPPEPPVIPGDIYTAVEDAYVSERDKGNNYGDKEELRVRGNSNNNFDSYVKFNIGKRVFVEKATLRLRMNLNSASLDVRIFGTSSDWRENRINYNNSPGKIPGRLGTETANINDGYVDIDVTEYAANAFLTETELSFFIESGNDNNAYGRFGTKENGYPAELIMEVGPGTPNLKPVARFSAAPTTGYIPLDVAFDASSSTDEDGEIVSYSWDFDDGVVRSGKQISHRFRNAGTYSVTLTVTDDKGDEGSTIVKIVAELPPNDLPVANIVVNPLTGPIALTVTFDGSGSSDSDGTINSYAWDFGDGNTAEGAQVSHTYTTIGTYTATLTVTDDDGATNQTTVSINAEKAPNVLPVANISANPLSGSITLNVNFDGSGSTDSDGSIVKYAWDFGDGNTAEGAQVSHSYSTIGKYVATLTVTDNEGATSQKTVEIDAQRPPNVPPLANIKADKLSGPISLTVNFDGRSSKDTDGDIVKYAWDFGDGSKGEGKLIKHTFKDIGTYSVTLVVTDNEGASHTSIVQVIAQEPPNVLPVANAVADVLVGDIPLTVNFDGSGSNDSDGTIVSYEWDFGEGTQTNGQSTSYTFTQVGNYTVSLIVTDDRGGSHTVTLAIETMLPNVLPVARILAGPLIGFSPLEVNFNGSLSSDEDGNIVSYLWDFGDGSTSDLMLPKHTYTVAGEYTATLTVTDNRGGTSTSTTQVLAKIDAIPVAVIKATAFEGKIPLEVELDANDSYDIGGEIVSYQWDFGDGNPVDGPTASRSFTTQGEYKVKLTVTDNDGRVGVKTIIITAHPENYLPIAAFQANILTGNAPMEIDFDASESRDRDGQIEFYSWDFGDGNTGSGVNPSHTFERGGQFEVLLIVVDDKGGKDTTSITLDLNDPPTATILATPESGIFPLAVLFDGSSSNDIDGSIVSYLWDLGDGTTSTEESPSHEYTEEGKYFVTLTVTDEDGAEGTTTFVIEAKYPEVDPMALPAMEASYVNSSHSGSNYGDRLYMMLKDNGPLAQSFVKFDLGKLEGRIYEAVLKLYKMNQGQAQIIIAKVGDDWQELNINYQNAPAPIGKGIGSIRAEKERGYYSIDVTSYVNAEYAGDKMVSFFISGPSNGGELELYSDEGAFPPVLELNKNISAEREGRPVPGGARLMTVYPNPFKEAFEVEFNNLEQGEITVELVTLTGKLLYSWQFVNKRHAVLSPGGELPSGMYFLVAKQGIRSEQVKIVKQ